jgi:hypothetical protein
MTATNHSPIDDETVFHKQLHRLLLRAHAGDVSLEGGWPCVNEVGTPSWDVEIFRLNKNERHELLDVDDEL